MHDYESMNHELKKQFSNEYADQLSLSHRHMSMLTQLHFETNLRGHQ